MSMDGIIGHLKGISRALNLTGEEYFAERILMQVEELEKQAALKAGAGDAQIVPAGWVLVPIEPSWDMRNEGREFLIDGLEKDYEKIAYFLWKTMVNASPKAPHG